MGTFNVRVQIRSLEGGRAEELEALVDTGSTYLSVPAPLLDSLGVSRVERRPFKLADGRLVGSDLGQVLLTIDGRAYAVPCLFAEPDSEPLLGAVALEIFGLAPDPVERRLIPVPGLRM
jgi:predicted aspartyl protease